MIAVMSIMAVIAFFLQIGLVKAVRAVMDLKAEMISLAF